MGAPNSGQSRHDSNTPLTFCKTWHYSFLFWSARTFLSFLSTSANNPFLSKGMGSKMLVVLAMLAAMPFAQLTFHQGTRSVLAADGSMQVVRGLLKSQHKTGNLTLWNITAYLDGRWVLVLVVCVLRFFILVAAQRSPTMSSPNMRTGCSFGQENWWQVLMEIRGRKSRQRCMNNVLEFTVEGASSQQKGLPLSLVLCGFLEATITWP